MKTIEALIEGDEGGRATLQFPADVPPGSHRVVVVIEGPARELAPLTFSSHDVGAWPDGFTVRREEIYGDDGR